MGNLGKYLRSSMKFTNRICSLIAILLVALVLTNCTAKAKLTPVDANKQAAKVDTRVEDKVDTKVKDKTEDKVEFKISLLSDLGVSKEVENKIFADEKYKKYPKWVGSTEYVEDGKRYAYILDYNKQLNMIIRAKSERFYLDAIAYDNIKSDEKINALTGEAYDLSTIGKIVDIRIEDDAPDFIKNYAKDEVLKDIKRYSDSEYNSAKIIDAKITKLKQINTGTASEKINITLWTIEYRLLMDDSSKITLAGGMKMDGVWLTELGSAGTPIIAAFKQTENDKWHKLNKTYSSICEEEFNGDYSEFAMHLYEKYKK